MQATQQPYGANNLYSSEAPPAVSFLSDYGLRDEFVGVVHSVLQRLAPGVPVIDLAHEIAPQHLKAGALTLWRCAPWLADGAVVAVVDPGVGTSRRAVAVIPAERPGLLFIGPDNGLMLPAIDRLGGAAVAVELGPPERLYNTGPTFDGRDLFAPVAARWCRTEPIEAFGAQIDPATLQSPPPLLSKRERGGVVAEVTWVDRFGNIQVALSSEDLDSVGDSMTATFSDGEPVALRRVETFSELGEDALGILIDSSGLAAIVANQSSAAQVLRVIPGHTVRLAKADDFQEPEASCNL